MRQIAQAVAYDLMVFMVDAVDHLTGKTGLTLTITASKQGEAFASISPTVTERGNGWYEVALTAAHTDTLGDLALHITASGADTVDVALQVTTLTVANIQSGLSTLDASGVRTAVGLATANLDSQLGNIQTSATTAADLATTAATNTQPGSIRTAVGLASANLDTQLGDLPTAAENATQIRTELGVELGRIDVAVSSVEGSSTPDARDLEPVQHVWNLKRSGDGALVSTNAFVVHPGDQNLRAGWNCNIPAILPSGTVIRTQGAPATDDLELTLTTIGHDDQNAKVEFDVAVDAVPGDYYIRTAITNSNNGGPITIYGKVTVQTAP